MSKKYRNIIFDVGEVLLDYQWKYVLTEIHGMDEEKAQATGDAMFGSGIWHHMDLWIREEEDILQEFDAKYPDLAQDIRWLVENGHLMSVDRPKVYEKVEELRRKGYQIYVLSNYPKTLFEAHTRNIPFMKDLDGMVVSCDVHVTKPDREIYEILLKRYDLKSEECLFFDDREENVEGAKQCGIDAIQVHSEIQLLKELEKLL